MKIKRTEWEALNARLAKLEAELCEVRRGTLMQTKTGPVLMNVVLPEILTHLKVESVHGYGWLLPLDRDRSETVGAVGE